MTIRGSGGIVRVGTYRAATLGAWTLQQVRGGYAVEATLVDTDAYWIAQTPTQVALAMASRTWQWTPRDAETTERRWTAILPGPPETVRED